MKTIFAYFYAGNIVAITAYGQDKMDVVYLKDLRVIKGSIIKPLDADGIQIMTTESDVYTFSAAEVSRVAREEISHDNLKTKCLYRMAKVSPISPPWATVSVSDPSATPTTTRIILPYTRSTAFTSTGISAWYRGGVEGYGDYELIPLYADIRVYPALTDGRPSLRQPGLQRWASWRKISTAV